ncbi:MAG: TVP38/TMEM64 family protein [Deltaproteobacteria bacterium]|nr:TVP38/TMEM64 family protein [Deltaproteobacteria bacterium]
MNQRLIKRLIIVGLVVAAILAFWLLDLGQYFSLSYIKQSQTRFQAYYASHPASMLGGYFVLYVLVTAFSLPGAAAMTLLGGALFGFWWTLLVVSFASSIGATLACFFARFVLGNWVQQKFGDKLEPINRGVEREGAFYLFTLRLVPLFPFFVINLVMGLTKMPLRTFYWVSQVGMLAGTAVFVNAGKELGQVDSLGGILSPGLVISFVILGIFPLAVKKGLVWYRRRTGRQAIIEP